MLVLVDRAHSDPTNLRQVGGGRNKYWLFCANNMKNKKKINNEQCGFLQAGKEKDVFIFYLSDHS